MENVVAVVVVMRKQNDSASLFVVPICNVIDFLAGRIALPHAVIQSLHVPRVDLTVE